MFALGGRFTKDVGGATGVRPNAYRRQSVDCGRPQLTLRGVRASDRVIEPSVAAGNPEQLLRKSSITRAKSCVPNMLAASTPKPPSSPPLPPSPRTLQQERDVEKCSSADVYRKPATFISSAKDAESSSPATAIRRLETTTVVVRKDPQHALAAALFSRCQKTRQSGSGLGQKGGDLSSSVQAKEPKAVTTDSALTIVSLNENFMPSSSASEPSTTGEGLITDDGGSLRLDTEKIVSSDGTTRDLEEPGQFKTAATGKICERRITTSPGMSPAELIGVDLETTMVPLCTSSELGKRVFICRTPTRLCEPIGYNQFQQPTLEEVRHKLKEFHEKRGVELWRNWVVWELSCKKESLSASLGKELEYQILPYRIPTIGMVPLQTILDFCSSVLFWLELDVHNVAIIMMYENESAFLVFLWSLLLTAEVSTKTQPSPSIEEITKLLEQSAVTGTPKGCPFKAVPFWSRLETWSPSRRRYLQYYHSFLNNENEGCHLRLASYQLKSVILENFVGPLDGLSLDVYHILPLHLIDGKLRDTLHQTNSRRRRLHRKEGRREKKLRSDSCAGLRSSPGRPFSLLSEPGQQTLDSAAASYEENCCCYPCAPEQDFIVWRALKKYLHARKYGGNAGRHTQQRQTHQVLLSPFGAVKHNSKSKPVWDDSSTVFLPTTESSRVAAVSAGYNASENTCSATYNFQACAPITTNPHKRRGSTSSSAYHASDGDAFPPIPAEPVTLCGDILILVRQSAPQTELALANWGIASDREATSVVKNRRSQFLSPPATNSVCCLDCSTPSSAALVHRRPLPVVAAYTFHTSFVEGEVLSVKPEELELFNIADSQIVRSPFKPSNKFGLHIVMSKSSVSIQTRPNNKTSRRPRTDSTSKARSCNSALSSSSRSCQASSLSFCPNSDEENSPRTGGEISPLVQDILDIELSEAESTGRGVQTPSRQLVPALNLKDIILQKSLATTSSPDICSSRSTRKKKGFLFKVFLPSATHGNAGGGPPPSSRSHRSASTSGYNTARRWAFKMTRSARQSRPASDSERLGGGVVLLDALWWQRACQWRQDHCRLPRSPPFSSIEEFCRRHILVSDEDKTIWSEEVGCTELEIVVAMKICNNTTLVALSFAHHYFSNDYPSTTATLAAISTPGRKKERTSVKSSRKNHTSKQPNGGFINKLKFKKLDLFLWPSAVGLGTVHKGTASTGAATERGSAGRRRSSARRHPSCVQGESAIKDAGLCKIDTPVFTKSPCKLSRADIEVSQGPESPTSCDKDDEEDDDWRSRESAVDIVVPDSSAKRSRSSSEQLNGQSKAARAISPHRASVDYSFLAEPLESARRQHAVKFSVSKSAALTIPASPQFSAVVTASTADAVTQAPIKKVPVAKSKKPPVLAAKKPPPCSGALASLIAKKADAAATREGTGLAECKAPLGRKLFWKPLGDTKGTVFAELERQTSIERIEFDVNSQLASQVFVKAVKKTPKVIKKMGPEESDKLTFMDAKRAQNVSIVMLRLAVSVETYAQCLRSLNVADVEVTLDDLQKIETILFTPEEEDGLNKFLRSVDGEEGNVERIRYMPEGRLLPLRSSCIPRLNERLKILLFNKMWKSWQEDLSNGLSTLELASQETRNSKIFRQVLSVVLRWGNFVNYGNQKEMQIKAITLGSLLKLTDFKTTIDLAVDDNIAHMASEMPTVKAAAKLSSESLDLLWKQLQDGLSLLKRETSEFRNSYKEEDSRGGDLGLSKLNEIEQEVSVAVSVLEGQARKAMSLVVSTAKFFGDDSASASLLKCTDWQSVPVTFQLGSFFVTFDSFLKKFEEAVSDVARRASVYVKLVPEELVPALLAFAEARTGKPAAVTFPKHAPPASQPVLRKSVPVKSPTNASRLSCSSNSSSSARTRRDEDKSSNAATQSSNRRTLSEMPAKLAPRSPPLRTKKGDSTARLIALSHSSTAGQPELAIVHSAPDLHGDDPSTVADSTDPIRQNAKEQGPAMSQLYTIRIPPPSHH